SGRTGVARRPCADSPLVSRIPAPFPDRLRPTPPHWHAQHRRFIIRDLRERVIALPRLPCRGKPCRGKLCRGLTNLENARDYQLKKGFATITAGTCVLVNGNKGEGGRCRWR